MLQVSVESGSPRFSESSIRVSPSRGPILSPAGLRLRLGELCIQAPLQPCLLAVPSCTWIPAQGTVWLREESVLSLFKASEPVNRSQPTP